MLLKINAEKVKVFAKEREYNGEKYMSYSIGLGNKNKDGDWENAYFDMKLKKGLGEIPNKSEIRINNGFLGFNIGKDEKAHFYIMVTDYELLSGGAVEDNDGFMVIPAGVDEDLPFAQTR